MTLVLHLGFYEDYSGAWMTGEREFWVDDEEDAQCVQDRYTAYFKNRYGDSAEVIRLSLTK